MAKQAAIAALGLSVMLAAAAPVRHAGEWEVTLNQGQPRRVCFAKDETFDRATLIRGIARVPGASCIVTKLETDGNVTEFASECMVRGSKLVSSGTITQTGADAFTSKIHSEGGVFPMSDGKPFTMPPMDIVNTSHRLGPCQPDDHRMPD